jgi:hypothetical protein
VICSSIGCRFNIIVKIKPDHTEYTLIQDVYHRLNTILTFTMTPAINQVTDKPLHQMERQELKDAISVYLYVR